MKLTSAQVGNIYIVQSMNLDLITMRRLGALGITKEDKGTFHLSCELQQDR